MNRYILVLLTVGVCATTVGCSCGRRAKKAREEKAAKTAAAIVSKAMTLASGEDTKVEVDGETVSFTGPDGQTTVHAGRGAQLPNDFPSDVPVYKPSDILHSMSQADGVFSVSMQTSDDLTKVAEYYKKQMEANGWASETAINAPQQCILAYEKDDRGVSLMIAQDKDGGTVVNVTTARK